VGGEAAVLALLTIGLLVLLTGGFVLYYARRSGSEFDHSAARTAARRRAGWASSAGSAGMDGYGGYGNPGSDGGSGGGWGGGAGDGGGGGGGDGW
jgi:hypothetical protein